MKRLALAIALACTVVAARAEFFDGNKLLSVCDATSSVDVGDCLGYTSGVYDAISGSVICPEQYSGRITRGQVRDIVVQYLRQNPALRSLTADLLIREALKPLWPCRNANPPAPAGRLL